MTRPDQERFDRFSQQLLVLDSALVQFCDANGFEMEVNAYRTPSRVFRRQRRAMEIIDIYLDGDWRVIDYSECLPCEFWVCSYYEVPDSGKKLYKIQRKLAGESSFLSLASKLDAFLQESLVIFDEWTPGVVVADGEEIER